MRSYLGLFISLLILTYMALASEKNILITKGYVVTPEEFEVGRGIYQNFCQNCHAGGVNGAPRLGYRKDWESRMEAGMEQLIKSLRKDHAGNSGSCPARGDMPKLSEEEIQFAMAYMVKTSTAK
jgi:cytochrome c5